MKKNAIVTALCLSMVLWSCGEQASQKQQIIVKNTMDADRSLETVSIALSSLDLSDTKGTLVLLDADSKSEITSQQVDTDGDGQVDELLFQPMVSANGVKRFEVTFSDTSMKSDSLPICYSRFVPERTDDYAWENNRVAFRTYGPKAQKMVEDSVKGGTLSSGMDAWLKRVEHPIINKWYKKELETDGSYHQDTGEGLDNFHVGISRGIGGIATKVDSSYYISRNFKSWKTLSTGPIRTSFILTYADWDAAGNKISEEKKISLDYGSNLSRFELTITGTDTISAGITLHKNEGTVAANKNTGRISYWEPHHGSELGTGIVVSDNAMVGYEHYVSDKKDESNLFAHLKTNNNKVVYYAGFAWKESGQFPTKESWESYLDTFARNLANPMTVEVN